MITQASTFNTQPNWTAGRQTIILADCLLALQKLDSSSIDVVVTSPPYNIGAAYNSYNDNQPRKVYLSWLQEISKQLSRVLRHDGSLFLNVGSTNVDPWIATDVAQLFRADFKLQNNITWAKSISIDENSFGHFKPIKSPRYLNQNYESIFHFTNSGEVNVDRLAIGVPFKDKTNIARFQHAVDRRCRGNVWFIPYKTVQSKAQKFNHPAGFPVDLPSRCMLLHGKLKMTVLDPFLGAGTTLVAAERLGHTGIGMEIDPEYIKISISRLEAEANNARR